jgi:hypothetical protein
MKMAVHGEGRRLQKCAERMLIKFGKNTRKSDYLQDPVRDGTI